MRENKAISLFKLLKVNELELLRGALVCDKRKRLTQLFALLVDLKNKPFTIKVKENFFQKLFTKSYSKDIDYLLRNEFRLFSEVLQDFLIDQEVKEELKHNEDRKNYYLLRAFQGRNALVLFDKEYNSAYQSAVQHADYYAAHMMASLNFYNHTQLQYLNEKELLFTEKLNDIQLSNLSRFYLTVFRTHQINREYTYSFSHPFSIHEQTLSKEIEVNFGKYENDFSGYLYLKAQSFLVPQRERMELLNRCLAFLEKHKTESPIFEEEKKFVYRALANGYSLLSNFEMSSTFFKKLCDLPMEENDPQRLAAICDYAANLIKLDKITEAIEWIEENETKVNQIEKLNVRILGLKMACYAFNGLAEKLGEILPNSLSGHNQQTKNFYKFYFSIHAYIDGRIADAYRESQNFIKGFRPADSTFDMRAILNFFNRFYNIVNTFVPENPKRKNYLQKLNTEIELYKEEALPEFCAYLPFLWLQKELQQINISLELSSK